MLALNTVPYVSYFSQCSAAEQIERLALTGGNVPLGDE